MAIYGLMFVLFLIPILRPLGLPIRVTEAVRKSYEAVEALPAGSTVLIALQQVVSSYPECEPYNLALLRHLLSKPVRFVIVSWLPDSAKIMEGALAQVADSAKANNKKAPSAQIR